MTESPVKLRHVLCVTPSAGLGGGIERLADAVVEYLTASGIDVQRLDLLSGGHRAGLLAKLQFVWGLRRAARRYREPFVLLVLHPALGTVGWLAARSRCRRRVVVVLYGVDVWGRERRVLYWLLARSRLRAVTISGFAAGAMLRMANAIVLAPGLGRQWYERLLDAARARPSDADGPPQILTTFRLASWAEKGLAELIGALDELRASWPMQLHVAGSGRVDPGLQALVTPRPWVVVHRQPSDEELAELYGQADVFVLATRTRPGRQAQGEGFGIVLVEAQLAGTPVIAPAFGGSVDTFLPGVTGLSPVDESSAALQAVLRDLLSDPARRRRMGAAATAWVQARFAPEVHAAEYRRVLVES